MYTYHPTPKAFRLSAWPYGEAGYVTVFNTERYRFDVRSVLAFIRERLEALPIAHVSPRLFSLVNMYVDFSQTSIGYSAEPPATVRKTQITFTFARSVDDYTGAPAVTSWTGGYTCVWGKTLNKPDAFITISVPINLIAKTRLQHVMQRDLTALYDMVGAYSKAVVMQQHPIGTQDVETIRSRLLNVKMPHAFDFAAIGDWKYCLDFWRRMPELIDDNAVDSKFVEYYCRFIAPALKVRMNPALNVFVERIKDEVTGFILSYMQSPDKVSERNLIPFLPALGETVDVETLASEIVGGKRQWQP